MDDPVRRVPALAAQVEVAVGVAVELGAEVDQVADPLGPLGHHHPDDVLVAQPRPGNEGVRDVRLVSSSGSMTAAMPPCA